MPDKKDDHGQGWKNGPLPPNTWGWGGAVPKDFDGSGFFFADFHGDHVILVGVAGQPERTLKADEVGMFCNCLSLPPRPVGAVAGEPAGRIKE